MFSITKSTLLILASLFAIGMSSPTAPAPGVTSDGLAIPVAGAINPVISGNNFGVPVNANPVTNPSESESSPDMSLL
ncbi:hypothetical protein SISSUDRAFT_1129030 [Sistotremastrum suecicum HHB10207 ss-3]|uniref:Uncharacterized protein n=1 Tax=Sistotremastrum suecicum HHB10207 ss-3 TaxID=1314776 RepID=A0A166D6X0_9AGAM|nr:hypothetical protein SISSUDRAFT_1129030 [Sistotremastrum suecicum HHB10207 ss-3]